MTFMEVMYGEPFTINLPSNPGYNWEITHTSGLTLSSRGSDSNIPNTSDNYWIFIPTSHDSQMIQAMYKRSLDDDIEEIRQYYINIL